MQFKGLPRGPCGLFSGRRLRMFWGALQAHTVCPGNSRCPAAPVVSAVSTPRLGSRNIVPRRQQEELAASGSAAGNCPKKRGGAGRRGSRAAETTRVGFSCVPWSYSTSLSCGGLNTEEKEAALSLGRAPAELPAAVLRAQIGWSGACGITPGEELCVPPLPFYGPQTTSQAIPCCVSHSLIIVGLPLRLIACGSPVGQAWRRPLLQGRERMNRQPGSLSDPQRTRPIEKTPLHNSSSSDSPACSPLYPCPDICCVDLVLAQMCVPASGRSGAGVLLSALGLNPSFITNHDCKMT